MDIFVTLAKDGTLDKLIFPLNWNSYIFVSSGSEFETEVGLSLTLNFAEKHIFRLRSTNHGGHQRSLSIVFFITRDLFFSLLDSPF